MNRPAQTLFVDITLDIGGAERVQQTIISCADRNRIEPMVALLRGKGKIAQELADDGFRIYDRLSSGKFDIGAVKSLIRIMREQGVEVIHTCNYPLVIGQVCLAKQMSGRLPLVVGLHSIGYAKRAAWRNYALKAVRPFITAFVAVSHGQKEHYIKTCGLRQDAIEVIYNGVDTKYFKSSLYDKSARIEFGIPEDAFVVGILASLRPEKRHDLFLQAASVIRRFCKDAFFLIVGDGPERRNIEALAVRLGIEDSIAFAGARTDVPRMLKAIDVSVMCSAPIVETLPVSLLEAMSMELPVVSTNVGSIDEIVEDGITGYLVPNGDVDGIAAKVLNLRQYRDLADTMGRAGRLRVEKAFTRETMVRRYEDLFERLADERRKK